MPERDTIARVPHHLYLRLGAEGAMRHALERHGYIPTAVGPLRIDDDDGGVTLAGTVTVVDPDEWTTDLAHVLWDAADAAGCLTPHCCCGCLDTEDPR